MLPSFRTIRFMVPMQMQWSPPEAEVYSSMEVKWEEDSSSLHQQSGVHYVNNIESKGIYFPVFTIYSNTTPRFFV